MQEHNPESVRHFCQELFRCSAEELQAKLRDRFNIPFTVLYTPEHGDLPCLFVQRMDTLELMRFFEEELDDKMRGCAPYERLLQRLMHRMENRQFDNYT